jgi:hypothetical protein
MLRVDVALDLKGSGFSRAAKAAEMDPGFSRE